MRRLEQSSRARLREAQAGRLRHAPLDVLPRHLHDHAFAAVVLSGDYLEAGDSGRHFVTAGDVILHRSWEAHLDRFAARGCDVLVLDIADSDIPAASGRIADPDAVVRLAERDPGEAARLMLKGFTPTLPAGTDWVDLLARALCCDPTLDLGAWAEDHALHPGSVSRGFRQAFGVTPSAYRLVQRSRRAIDLLQNAAEPLSEVAQIVGFADQSHMTRSIRSLVGQTPTALRRMAGAPRLTGREP